MSDKPENPPAFPNSVQPDFQFAEVGMTLRDWFAGQALPQAIDIARKGAKPDYDPAAVTVAIAGIAYDLADAMLAERNK